MREFNLNQHIWDKYQDEYGAGSKQTIIENYKKNKSKEFNLFETELYNKQLETSKYNYKYNSNHPQYLTNDSFF
jgi:hypothetical protein